MEQTNVPAPVGDDLMSPVSKEEAEKLDDRSLLELYQRTGDQDLKWMLVLRYTPLVRRIAMQASGVAAGTAQRGG